MNSSSDSATLRRIGLGLAAVGRPAYITTNRAHDLGPAAERTGEALYRRTHTLLEVAWLNGIRFFDVARSYGRAEEFLGMWLDAHPDRRADLIIESKWGYEYTGAWSMTPAEHERKNHSLAFFERQWGQTLHALRTTPNRYLIHSVTPESPALEDKLLLDRLRDLSSTGVTVGLSTSGEHQAAIIRAALDIPHTPFSTVQTTWNILEQSAAPALQEAHAAGWSIVVKEALANGRLLNPPPTGTAAQLLRQSKLESDAFALGATLGQPWADYVLSGAATPEHLRSNLRADPLTMPPQELSAATLSPQVYWSQRAQLAWS